MFYSEQIVICFKFGNKNYFFIYEYFQVPSNPTVFHSFVFFHFTINLLLLLEKRKVSYFCLCLRVFGILSHKKKSIFKMWLLVFTLSLLEEREWNVVLKSGHLHTFLFRYHKYGFSFVIHMNLLSFKQKLLQLLRQTDGRTDSRMESYCQLCTVCSFRYI